MKELMSYLPEDYEGSQETVTIQQAIQPELDTLWKKRDDLLLQLNPNTATWGLVYWEKAFGLPVDTALLDEKRRIRIAARLRGMQTTTVAALQSVVESFCPGCDVSIVERYSEYLVEIRLGITDQPVEDTPGLTETLHLIMPAHLGWGYAFFVETTGTIIYGISSEMSGLLEIWPLVARQVELVGTLTATGALSCQGILEIYPKGGMLNG